MTGVPQGEPGGWELRRALTELREDSRRGFADLNARLDKLVSADAFAAEQRRVDDRLADLAQDIAQEREQRQAGDADQQKAIDRQAATLRWVAVAIVLPIALFLANLYFTQRGAR